MKKLTALILTLCLMISAFPAQAAYLVDQRTPPPTWSETAYNTLLDRFSTPVEDFFSASIALHSSGTIDRRSFAGLLIALLDYTFPSQTLSLYPEKETGYFYDAPYDTVCLRAAGYGIAEGSFGADGQRYFSTDVILNREQAAKMVCSMLDFVSQKLDYPLTPANSPAVYADAAFISSWALPYTQQIAAYGLMKGDGDRNFNPQGELDWPSSVVLASRILELLDAAVSKSYSGLSLQGKTDWLMAARFGANDYSVSRPLTGWAKGYYTIDNGDGTVSGLVVDSDGITVERFAADGSLVSSKIIANELPIFGAFLDGGDRFYLAFGQENDGEEDSCEVWRIVQYDRNWTRLASASVNGGDSYTTLPFRSAVARMAVSGDGKTLALHAARQRYTTPDDGLRHQSNITITMNTADMKVLSVSEVFPSNHVSHSFGQFVRYDGNEMVTVDHGDAYPRSFVLHDGKKEAELLKIAGAIGENVTNAIGSGLEIAKDGYLFLGCSAPQDGTEGPWNLFLTYTSKTDKETTFTWLTHSDTDINCARLVKLGEDSFLAMWQEGTDIHYQKLNGRGELAGQGQVLAHTTMPPTDPVVIDGDVCWIQTSSLPRDMGKPVLYRIALS